MDNIYNDNRRIRYIRLLNDTVVFADKDYKIIPYHENGDLAVVVWFAHYNKDDIIIARFNSKYIAVVRYWTDEDDEVETLNSSIKL